MASFFQHYLFLFSTIHAHCVRSTNSRNRRTVISVCQKSSNNNKIKWAYLPYKTCSIFPCCHVHLLHADVKIQIEKMTLNHYKQILFDNAPKPSVQMQLMSWVVDSGQRSWVCGSWVWVWVNVQGKKVQKKPDKAK